jgi:hypothetical protein
VPISACPNLEFYGRRGVERSNNCLESARTSLGGHQQARSTRVCEAVPGTHDAGLPEHSPIRAYFYLR